MVILEMYISLLPVIAAGILNMIWCKSNAFSWLAKPIDAGKSLSDNRRIFGENKTFKGFVGMLVFGIALTVLWGILCGENRFLTQHNYLYRNYENTVLYNAVLGSFLGFAYALMELPNSFIKRRLDIKPGKTANGRGAVVSAFMDQADSVFGCVGVIACVYKMSILFYLLYVLVGTATHMLINLTLYALKLRKNPL